MRHALRVSVMSKATVGLACMYPSLALAQASAPPGQGGYGGGTYGSPGYGSQGTYGSSGYGSPQGTQGGGYGSQSGSGMQAGGLSPPSSADSDSQQTEQRLEEAEQKDSGRGLEFLYINGEAGVTHLGLQTFKANNLLDAGVVSTTQTGPTFGAGIGVRLVFITLGARFRLSSFSQYQVWTLGGELGLRIPLGMVEPYFTLGAGFASLGSFDKNDLGGAQSSGVSVKGYDIRAGFGVDVYLTPVFSIGGNLSGDVLGLTRPGVSPSSLTTPTTTGDVYRADGSSLGLGGTLTAVAGLHF